MKLQYVYDTDAPRKPVSLTANADLVKHAKKAGINLSKTFEEAVLVKLRASLEEGWLRENRAGIEAYNERIARRGVFGAAKRRF